MSSLVDDGYMREDFIDLFIKTQIFTQLYGNMDGQQIKTERM